MLVVHHVPLPPACSRRKTIARSEGKQMSLGEIVFG